ncbi:MAG: GNAT family N-acetyltransferase [Candidatus Izemoplasmatales bacterium]
MLNYSTCEIEDIAKAIQLSVSVFKPNMKEQFLCLFHESNRDHMFIAKEEDQIVSMVNYYPSVVKHPLFRFKVASVGSVCTHPNFRRRNIAYELLLNAEKQMIKEDIALTIISGGGGIYTKFGSNEVGNIFEYSLSRHFIFPKNQIEVVPFENKYLQPMFEIYKKETLSFERTFDEFKLLFQGQTTPDSWADYPTFIVRKDQETIGYIILNRERSKRTISVKEFAGNRKLILSALSLVLKQTKKLSVRLYLDPTDEMNAYLLSVHKKNTDLHASIKIINPLLLFQNLRTYFQVALGEDSTYFNVNIAGEDINLIYKDFVHQFDIYQLNQLVFGQSNDIIKQIPQKEMREVLEQVFPIPFVWVNNLNYQ